MVYRFLLNSHSITFVEQLNGISTVGCRFFNGLYRIKQLTLYKNDLKHLKDREFFCHPLNKLSLVNNNIETVGRDAFRVNDVIEEINVAENRISRIRIFDGFRHNSKLRVLNFKKNIICLFEP